MTTEIKCTNCGTINVGELMRCRICGHPLHHSEAEVRKCPQCNSTATPMGEDRCVSCGWNFATNRPAPPNEEREPVECETPAEADLHTVRAFNVDLAVIFMLLAGGLGVIYAVLTALPGTRNVILSGFESMVPMMKPLDDFLQDQAVGSILLFVLGALAIALSWSALKRSSYAGAVAGAVFGIASIGFLFGAFFGLMALILLLISKREFLLECV